MKYILMLLLVVGCSGSLKVETPEEDSYDRDCKRQLDQKEKAIKSCTKELNRCMGMRSYKRNSAEVKIGIEGSQCQRELNYKDRVLTRCSSDLDLCMDMYNAPANSQEGKGTYSW